MLAFYRQQMMQADAGLNCRIAKFEAAENDLPASAGFRVQGFPTIKFKPAGSDVFLDYEGDRSIESFLEYIETNSKNGAKPDAPKPVSSPPATEGSGHHDELCESQCESIICGHDC